MSEYDWKTIFQSKDEKELINIYSGESNLNSEAEIYAELELKNRNFDPKKIEEIRINKMEKLKLEISDLENSKFTSSEFFKTQINYGIGFAVFLVLALIVKGSSLSESLLYFGSFILLFIFLTIWKTERFKKENAVKLTEKTERLRKNNYA